MRMRMTMAAVLAGVICTAAYAEVPTASAPAAAPVDPEVVKTLDLLEARGKTLTDFTSNLVYDVEHPRDESHQINTGTAALVNTEKEKRFAVVLDKLITGNTIGREGINHQIVFDGEWFIDKDPDLKVFRKIQVAKPGAANSNVFGLRGMIPLPIGQKTSDVLADFDAEKSVAKMEGKSAPAAVSAIKLTPKKGKNYDFEDLTVIVDTAKDVELPVRLIRTGKDGNITTITFVKPQINTGAATKAAAVIVDEPKKEDGWSVEVRPLDEK